MKWGHGNLSGNCFYMIKYTKTRNWGYDLGEGFLVNAILNNSRQNHPRPLIKSKGKEVYSGFPGLIQKKKSAEICSVNFEFFNLF